MAPGTAPSSAAGSSPDLARFFAGTLTATGHGSFGLDRARLVADPGAPGGRLLRVGYPAGSASPAVTRREGAPPGGAQAYLRLPRPADGMTLSYSVRFPVGFRFVRGGKLPGLFGGDAGSGGRHRPGGFSTRFMWRTAGAGEVYAYLPHDTGYGTSLGRGRWTHPPGRWTRLTQHVRVNTPGTADGTVAVAVDGRAVFTQGGLVLRDGPEVQVDGLFFCTFFGGGDSGWATPTDQTVDLAGFSLTADRGCGPRRRSRPPRRPGSARPGCGWSAAPIS